LHAIVHQNLPGNRDTNLREREREKDKKNMRCHRRRSRSRRGRRSRRKGRITSDSISALTFSI